MGEKKNRQKPKKKNPTKFKSKNFNSKESRKTGKERAWTAKVNRKKYWCAKFKPNHIDNYIKFK